VDVDGHGLARQRPEASLGQLAEHSGAWLASVRSI
jgi:hypothetical protein